MIDKARLARRCAPIKGTQCRYVETSVGLCRIDWSGELLQGVHLNQSLSDESSIADSVPPFVAEAIDGIRRAVDGQPVAFDLARLDWSLVRDFSKRVLITTHAIPPGRTMTYKEVAAAVGSPGAMRAVGQALGKNPWSIIVPCHRVLGSRGLIGGFSAPDGTRVKQALLLSEARHAGLSLPLTDTTSPAAAA